MKAKLSTAFLISISAFALLAAQSPAQSQKPVPYRGKSDQSRPIQFSTSQNQITLIRFKVKMLCRDGSLLSGDASDFEASALRANGAFADVQHGNTDTVAFKGRVKGNQLKGTLRVKDRLKSGVRCDSGPVSFTAKRAGG